MTTARPASPHPKTVRRVQARHVRRHAHRAITQRLGRAWPDAVIGVPAGPDYPNAVVLHVNSGGNMIACTVWLTRAGYRREDLPPAADRYSARVRVLPGSPTR